MDPVKLFRPPQVGDVWWVKEPGARRPLWEAEVRAITECTILLFFPRQRDEPAEEMRYAKPDIEFVELARTLPRGVESATPAPVASIKAVP